VNVIALQVFVSLTLVAGSIVLFIFSVRQRDFDHGDRLSLAPLEPDPVAPRAAPETPASPTAAHPARRPGNPSDSSPDHGKGSCTPNASNTTTP
jgi:hypothetical protein